MKKRILVLLAAMFATACATGKHLHHVPKAEYELPCVIENARVEVLPDTWATDKACSDLGRIKDNGEPMKKNEVIGGCFKPLITLADGGVKLSGTLVVTLDRKTLADEMEHLIWNACKKSQKAAGK